MSETVVLQVDDLEIWNASQDWVKVIRCTSVQELAELELLEGASIFLEVFETFSQKVETIYSKRSSCIVSNHKLFQALQL
jgi:hypothetical protein